MSERSVSERVAERRESLWILPAAPAIWAAHFLVSYATVALWCGKYAGPGAPLATGRIAVAVYTAVAMAAVLFIGYRGYRRHRLGGEDLPHDDDSPEDRYRFLGFATVLLAGLSAIAILYAALAALFIETCW